MGPHESLIAFVFWIFICIVFSHIVLGDLRCNKKQFKAGRVSSGIEFEKNQFTLMENGQKVVRGFHRQSRKQLASMAPANNK